MPSRSLASGGAIWGIHDGRFDLVRRHYAHDIQGGVGKSTLARGLAAYWYALGRKPAKTE